MPFRKTGIGMPVYEPCKVTDNFVIRSLHARTHRRSLRHRPGLFAAHAVSHPRAADPRTDARGVVPARHRPARSAGRRSQRSRHHLAEARRPEQSSVRRGRGHLAAAPALHPRLSDRLLLRPQPADRAAAHAIVNEVVGQRTGRAPRDELHFNPELAPLDMLLNKAQQYELLPAG